MSVPFPHDDNFYIQDTGYNEKLVELFWKVSRILHDLIFNANDDGTLPYSIQNPKEQLKSFHWVSKNSKYVYGIIFEYRLTDDTILKARITTQLSKYDYPLGNKTYRTVNSWFCHINLKYHVSPTKIKKRFATTKSDIFERFPGYEETFLRMMLSSPFIILNPGASGNLKYVYNDQIEWAEALDKKYDEGTKVINEEERGLEHVALILTLAKKETKLPHPWMVDLTHHQPYMYEIRNQIEDVKNEKLKRLIRNQDVEI